MNLVVVYQLSSNADNNNCSLSPAEKAYQILGQRLSCLPSVVYPSTTDLLFHLTVYTVPTWLKDLWF